MANKAIQIAAAAAVSAVAGFLLYRRFMQHRILKQTKLTGGNAIDEWVYPMCNGVEHALLVRGKNKRAPVLLMVHGGPGTPDAPLARHTDDALVERFVVVRYDQRATGKTEIGEHKISELNVRVYAADVIAVAEYVKARFPNQPLVLVGHSWGSFIGLLAASQAPHLFDAYVGVGQFVNIRESEPASLRYALQEATRNNKKKAIKTLSQLNPHDFYLDFDKLLKQRRVLLNVGGVFYDNRVGKKLFAAANLSPDYSMMELMRVNRRFKQLGRQLYWQMVNYDFTKLIPRMDIPVFFISGVADRQFSPELARDYLDKLEAPQKDFIWIERGGHFANFEQPEAFCKALVDITERLGLTNKTKMEAAAYA